MDMILKNITTPINLDTRDPQRFLTWNPATDAGPVSTDRTTEENEGPGVTGPRWVGLGAGVTGGALLVLTTAVVIHVCVRIYRKRKRVQLNEKGDGKVPAVDNGRDEIRMDRTPNDTFFSNAAYVPEQTSAPTIPNDYDHPRTMNISHRETSEEVSRQHAIPSVDSSNYENTFITGEQVGPDADTAQYQNFRYRTNAVTEEQTDSKWQEREEREDRVTELKRCTSKHVYVAMNKKYGKSIYDHLNHGNRLEDVIERQDSCYSHIEPTSPYQDTSVTRPTSTDNYQNLSELSDIWWG